ncbi:MAG: hypothetical protein HDR97_00360 [Bacteroides sp.]|nr:hypothetical protein [Bacteroides sp.]
MKLVKTNESWSRSFDSNGEEANNRLDLVQFNIVDDNGTTVGNASVWQGNASVNINLSGFSTIEEGEAKLKELFGIID